MVCGLAGCASIPASIREYDRSAAGVELRDVPFHAQERYQCGPAALLTVLEYSGANVELPSLVRQVYLPARQGSLQPEMLAATRAAERVPYRIDAGMAALASELAAGRPVLVLQNLGVSWFPRWHYAVVVGLDTEAETVVLRSGVDERRLTPVATFLRTWRRSGYWGFVPLRPGTLPENARQDRYFDAVAGLEQTGHIDAARDGWQAGLQRWPQSPVALFGLANADLLTERWQSAERTYRELLRQQPGLAVARNNLALSLLRQRRFDEAAVEARRALQQAGEDPNLRAAVEDTLDEITAASP